MESKTPQQSKPEPMKTSERLYPRLSPEEQEATITEFERLQRLQRLRRSPSAAAAPAK
jgi:hypothetical protein